MILLITSFFAVKRTFFPVLLVFFTFSEVQAQWVDSRKDYKYKFMARVIDADTAIAIPNCHIINKTQNMGTISDEFGNFTVTANVGDSLMFSAVGYGRTIIAVRDSMYTNNRVVTLKSVAYVLSEVEIGLLSTYDRFKRDFLMMEAEEAYKIAPISKFIPPAPYQGGVNIPLAYPLANPITFLYDLWSKEGKQYRHYLSVINGTAEFIIIGDKFNGILVKQLTGLENDELVKFMSYCMFTKDYLLAAPEREIQQEIIRKYKQYIRLTN